MDNDQLEGGKAFNAICAKPQLPEFVGGTRSMRWPHHVHFVLAENPVSSGVPDWEQSQGFGATNACQRRGNFLGA